MSDPRGYGLKKTFSLPYIKRILYNSFVKRGYFVDYHRFEDGLGLRLNKLKNDLVH